jgi:hypothetical protein
VELIVATSELDAVGGIQSYALTIASALQRLGNGVTLYAERLGDAARLAEEAGLRVTTRARELPRDVGAVLPQDASSAIAMLDLLPRTPLVYVAHGPDFDGFWPPQLEGAVGAVVALSERSRRRLETLAVVPRIERLSQPIDLARFGPRGALREQPREVLLLGNHLNGPRLDLLTSLLDELGLRWSRIGSRGEPSSRPEEAIARADVVVGYSRSILEGMAMGRAAYVYDFDGTDGWVTPASYAEMEADGFRGIATDRTVARDRLRADLLAYSPEMGPANRDLVRRHHNALDHAGELVRLLRDLGVPQGPSGAPLFELKRLSRREFQQAQHARAVERHLQEVHERLARAERELEELRSRRRRWRS